jgi:hypothetical protein
MARLSTTGANDALAGLLVPGTTYNLALFVTDPSTTGASGEVSGGSYARQPIVFGTPSGGAQQGPTSAVGFTSMPALPSGVSYFGIFTTGGTYLVGGALTGLNVPLSAGATVTISINAITAALA